MSNDPDPSFQILSEQKEKSDTQEKKMIGGSFAVSLVVHAILLLIIGSIVIVPAAMEKIMPVTSVAPPPMDIPEPPPMDDSTPADSLEEEGTPISEVKEAATSREETTASELDALVVDSPLANAPRLNASSGTGALSSDVFAERSAPSGSGGTGNRGTGKGGRTTFFGSQEKFDNSMIGKFYDLKQTRSRTPSTGDSAVVLRDFFASGFTPAKLKDYFSPSQLLYAPYIFLPWMKADEAPKAYGVEKDVKPSRWVAHYRALVAPPTDGTFRFVGVADDFLVVGINGQVVLDGSYPVVSKPDKSDSWALTAWRPKDPTFRVRGSAIPMAYGDWIEWRASEFKKIDVLVGEWPGGQFYAYLLIQQKGKNYKTGDNNSPILSLFRLDGAKIEFPPEILKANNYPEYSTGPIFKAKHVQ